MGINGTAYATWAAPGGGGADVRVARLQDVGVADDRRADRRRSGARRRPRRRSARAWRSPARATRSWRGARTTPTAAARVWERRVTGMTFSAFPQELSLPSLGGAPGGRADSVDIDVEDDGGFGWAVFRQDFGGGSRSIGRRLLGLDLRPARGARRRAAHRQPAARPQRARPGAVDVRGRQRRARGDQLQRRLPAGGRAERHAHGRARRRCRRPPSTARWWPPGGRTARSRAG